MSESAQRSVVQTSTIPHSKVEWESPTSMVITSDLTAVDVRWSGEIEAMDKIARHPEVWPNICDDASPPPDKFTCAAQGFPILGLYSNNHLVGFWMVVPTPYSDGKVAEVHTCILPEGRGRIATTGAPIALHRIFLDTPACCLIARIPVCNPQARKFATWCGFKPAYLERGTWVKDGRAYDAERLYLSILDWVGRSDAPLACATTLLRGLSLNGLTGKIDYLYPYLRSIFGDALIGGV